MEDILEQLNNGHERSEAERRRVGRPSLSGAGSSPRMSFRTSSDLFTAAQQRAEEEGISISELARKALERHLSG